MLLTGQFFYEFRVYLIIVDFVSLEIILYSKCPNQAGPVAAEANFCTLSNFADNISITVSCSEPEVFNKLSLKLIHYEFSIKDFFIYKTCCEMDLIYFYKEVVYFKTRLR